MTAHSDRTIRCACLCVAGMRHSQVAGEIDAGLILEAATRAVTFWPDDPLLLRGLLTRPPQRDRDTIHRRNPAGPAISDRMMACSSDDQLMA
jgi:hypothetical protein